MEATLHPMEQFTVLESNQEGIKLLDTIKNISHQHGDTKQAAMAVFQSDNKLYLFLKKSHMSNTEYLKQFNAHVEVIDEYGGTAVHHLKRYIHILKN